MGNDTGIWCGLPASPTPAPAPTTPCEDEVPPGTKLKVKLGGEDFQLLTCAEIFEFNYCGRQVYDPEVNDIPLGKAREVCKVSCGTCVPLPTTPLSTTEPTTPPPTTPQLPSQCSAQGCIGPGACLLIEGYDNDGEPDEFTCEEDPSYFTDPSVCEND